MKPTIEWHQAVKLQENLQQENKESTKEAIEDFLSENNQMADGRDLQYWSHKTGKDLDWIFENGININPLIKEVYYTTGDLDDVWDYN